MTSINILDAINARLLSVFPTRTVYIDVCPVDFTRPSFWLSILSHHVELHTKTMCRHTLTVSIVLYDTVDEVYESSWMRLLTDSDSVLSLFSHPLPVAGRVLCPTLNTQPRQVDRAEVVLTFSWLEAISTQETLPVSTTLQVKT